MNDTKREKLFKANNVTDLNKYKREKELKNSVWVEVPAWVLDNNILMPANLNWVFVDTDCFPNCKCPKCSDPDDAA